MGELQTRELECFIAVAEELHFGRAAQRLSISQPGLSKTIRRMERRLGAQLLQRSARGVSLTPSGIALLQHGRGALDAMNLAARSVTRADADRRRLRMVLKREGSASLPARILAAWRERPGACEVDIVFGGTRDRAEHLRDGRADVGLLYVPFDSLTGLDHATLCVEGRVAILPRAHRLATREEVRMDDLQHERLARWTDVGSDGWTGAPTGLDGPEVSGIGEMLHLVAVGQAVAVLPGSLVQGAPPELRTVPVRDAPLSRTVLAWRAGDGSPLVSAFVASAVAASNEVEAA